MTSLKVAILGTGPSAAYAAMACEEYPIEYDIISNRTPTTFFPGAFWVRLNPTSYIRTVKREVGIYSVGTAEGYLRKQWGIVDPAWFLETSFPAKFKKEMAINPYELFKPFWKSQNITLMRSLSDIEIKGIAKDYNLVIMTFATQRSKEVMKPYTFTYPFVSYIPNEVALLAGESYCIYDGYESHFIVRMSYLFGHVHLEYAKDYIPKKELVGDGKITWVPDTLPDSPEWDPTDVPSENIVLSGRFAQWKRKVLSHEAYDQTKKAIEERW